MSPKILIFFLFSSLLAWSSADYGSQPETSESRIKKYLVTLDTKINSLNKEFEQLKADRSTGNDANCVDSSINSTLVVINAVQQLFQTQFNEIKRDVTSEMTSRVSRVEGRLDTVESQLNQQKRCENACEPNPCIYGGSCVSILCGKDFMCDKCPKFRSGLRCEKLDVKCEGDDKCWQYKNTVYVAFEPKSIWTEAERKCEAEGMSLIMPKEKDQNEFIVNQLKAVYGSAYNPYFWLGLKRESGSAWKWLDGSELGTYTGGTSGIKSASGDLNGFLYFKGKDYIWSSYGRKSSAYPLCEKRV